MSPSRDIIVIGGSAGAVEGLTRLVPGLPADLPARVFIVVHVPPTISVLPEILTRRGNLPAVHPADGEATRPGTIYLAPPDHHLLVGSGRVRVVSTPREHGHRPSIDLLFRSAAEAHGARVVCVVLSGTLSDGAASARAVHDAGGAVIIQDPGDSRYRGMPQAARRSVPAATVLPLAAIAAALVALAEPDEAVVA